MVSLKKCTIYCIVYCWYNYMADLNSWSFTLGACVEVLVTETNELMGIFFQDSEMQQIFKSYPQFICLDATYKLLEFSFLFT